MRGTLAVSSVVQIVDPSLEMTLDGEVDDMVWVGAKKATVFVLTTLGRLYRSTDSGKHWVDEEPKLRAAMAYGARSAAGKAPLRVVRIEVSAADRSHLVFVGASNAHWSTQSAGGSYIAMGGSLLLHEMKMHPTTAGLILSSTMSDKCHNVESDPSGFCFKNLWLTHDSGAHWKFLTSYVVQFDWVHNLEKYQAHGMPVDAIFATEYQTKTGAQRFGYWDADISMVLSTNHFRSKTVLVRHGNRFLFTPKYLFVAKVNPQRPTEVTLEISSDAGRHWETADLPFVMNQHSYTILDTSEDSVFLHVNHEGASASYGNVYISNAVGMNYTLSLPRNRRAKNGKCDFEKMEGLEGIYMANYIDVVDAAQTGGAAAAYDALDFSMGQVARVGQSRSAVRAKVAQVGPAKEHLVRTVISFDKGAVWGYLKAPAHNAVGQPYDLRSCADCSLHLHGVTDEWGPFYSTKAAIGLIMATGNVGTALTTVHSEINTYFSRDAGLTWFEVAQGSHIYEFGDHGALVVMANDVKATTEVLYSWNEGLDWQRLAFTKTPMHVDNVIIEPSTTSQQFIVYGSRTNSQGRRVGVIVHLDFAMLHERACVGASTPGTPTSDYELWTPSDGRLSGQCLMGHKVQYVRRKRASTCFNGEKIDRVVSRTNCACAEQDWECSKGWAREIHDPPGPCKELFFVDPAAQVPRQCSGKYGVSKGYRLVAGDTCDLTKPGSVDHSPTMHACPRNIGRSGWFVLLLILFLIVGLATVTYQNGRVKRARRAGAALFTGGFSGSAAGNSAQSVWDAIRKLSTKPMAWMQVRAPPPLSLSPHTHTHAPRSCAHVVV